MKDTNQQVRLTLEDTIRSQNKLRVILQQLIQYNRALLDTEKEEFFELVSKSLLSQGTGESVNFVYEGGWFQFASAQNLAQRMSDLTTEKVYLKTIAPEVVEATIPISTLWKFLYNWCLYLFPRACAESWHISAESQMKQKAGTYSFSSGGKQ
jgi:hypothetical protein